MCVSSSGLAQPSANSVATVGKIEICPPAGIGTSHVAESRELRSVSVCGVNFAFRRSTNSRTGKMTKGSEIFRGVLEAARKQLLLDFDTSKGFAHSGIKGEERAEALAVFLKSRLPPAFGITTGEVIDNGDRRTGQLDLIIYDQTVTQAVHTGRKNELFPCEAVYAVIEVKSVLNRGEVRASQPTRPGQRFHKAFRLIGIKGTDQRIPANVLYRNFGLASRLDPPQHAP